MSLIFFLIIIIISFSECFEERNYFLHYTYSISYCLDTAAF
ncbi:unnamed protein product [Acanthoscelides obtectus]|uniref:Uncharacterized protein n=1 Tax=Acanthoscelides obtectus TaxID=200917 RepID=A0A9P0KEW0_ACAOB|nr:unnamed protein product [Acanthoscelides obtectus]CAK1632431.1 hypothetical protein AOBTE_LOCUS7560 [Acanthoscelides obtectus]